jgi:hypothetical protein
MIARLGDQMHLQHKLAAVDAELRRGIGGEGELRSGREVDAGHLHPRRLAHGQIRRNQPLLPRRMRVDVQPADDAEVQLNRLRLARGLRHLLRVKKMNQLLIGGVGSVRRVLPRQLLRGGDNRAEQTGRHHHSREDFHEDAPPIAFRMSASISARDARPIVEATILPFLSIKNVVGMASTRY